LGNALIGQESFQAKTRQSGMGVKTEFLGRKWRGFIVAILGLIGRDLGLIEDERVQIRIR
jgi:hypothetical protein